MDIQKEIAKFAPVKLTTSARLSVENRMIFAKIKEAADIADRIFFHQSYAHNETLEQELTGETLELFKIFYGPFNKLDHNKSFVPGHTRPLGANLYPVDMTKEEFEQHLTTHPEDRKLFESEYTAIRRDASRKLVAVPYSQLYREPLQKISSLFQEAAEICSQDSLKNFLLLRARDFIHDNYMDSDIAWMDLTSNLDITFAPYEVYEDELFGYKAFFEAVISVKLPQETAQLKKFEESLPLLEQHLPIKGHGKRGPDSPLLIADLLYSAGEPRAGVHFVAFNLPNDERIRKVKGAKKVLMRNVSQAKYDTCWIPIAKKIIHPDILDDVSFDAYFTHILLHEISHSLGPGIITVNGKTTTVNKALQETYSLIEEAKADALGVFCSFVLADHGIISSDLAQQIAITFAAGVFRSVRFGINEAHGGANIVLFNLFEDEGFVYWDNSLLHVDASKARAAFTKAVTILLKIERDGDYMRAKKLVDAYRIIRPSMAAALEKLVAVPVDIRIDYPDI